MALVDAGDVVSGPKHVGLMRRINALQGNEITIGNSRDFHPLLLNTDIMLPCAGEDDTIYYADLTASTHGFFYRVDSDFSAIDSLNQGGSADIQGALASNDANIFYRLSGLNNTLWYRDLSLGTEHNIAVAGSTSIGAATTSRVFKATFSGITISNDLLDGTDQTSITINDSANKSIVSITNSQDGNYLYVHCEKTSDSTYYVQQYDADGIYITTKQVTIKSDPACFAVSNGGTVVLCKRISPDHQYLRFASYNFTTGARISTYDLFMDGYVIPRKLTVSQDGTVFQSSSVYSDSGFITQTKALIFTLGPINWRNQSRFYRYPTLDIDDAQSIGVPDGGVSTPATTAFSGRGPWSPFTYTGNANNNEVVTIFSIPYTYKMMLTGAAYEVKIGASATASRDNLIAAIMGTTGEGTTYGFGTVPNAYAGAAIGPTGTTMLAYAYTCSALSNFGSTTTTMANASWPSSIIGGVNPYDAGLRVTRNPIQDMRDAIEALAPYYLNEHTGNPFNWTDSDADNLYFVALGSVYDWQAPLDKTRDLDLNEIDAILTLLEGSERI